MTLAKAESKAKHIYSTDVTYDRQNIFKYIKHNIAVLANIVPTNKDELVPQPGEKLASD